jgi:hypothetical protein
MDGDPGLQLDDAGGDLEQAEAQGVELGMAPGRSRHEPDSSPAQFRRGKMDKLPMAA